MKIKYIADDGAEFNNEIDCQKYEEKLKKEEQKKKQAAIIQLELDIWKKYYPDYDTSQLNTPDYSIIYIWFTTDIESILLEYPNALPEILSVIHNSDYSEEIMRHIDVNHIVRNVEIRRNFDEALASVKRGTDLSSELDFCFSNDDLCQLIELHKKNKYRSKIESLLTDCNFHYVCGLLKTHKYDEILKSIA